MHTFKLILGMLWASPVTLLSFLFYIAPLWALGRYTFIGWDEIAWIWSFNPATLSNGRLNLFLKRRWRRWLGSALGNNIIITIDPRYVDDSYDRNMLHEKEHVKQYMRLGIFHPILYVIIYLTGRFVLKNTDGYFDSILEIDDRRKAGQLIDVVGTLNRLKNEAKKHDEVN